MEIKFNKGFSILVITILILINMFGQTLILSFSDIVRTVSNDKASTIHIFVMSISSFINYLPNLLIGIWLFTMVNKFKQDKWSWSLIGFVFGQYSLIFLSLLLLVQGIKLKMDINKAFRPLLILLIISIFLNATTSFLIKPYLTMNFNTADYGLFGEYKSYLSFVNLGFIILIHIILAVKIYHWIGHLQMKGKFLWSISTVFLGLLPLILFTGFALNKIEENEKNGI